uniref:SUN domain-containing protein n=1 Tax=Catharus ustulatus TaxID=91951 RepID=A0A8C3U7W9_CATUS
MEGLSSSPLHLEKELLAPPLFPPSTLSPVGEAVTRHVATVTALCSWAPPGQCDVDSTGGHRAGQWHEKWGLSTKPCQSLAACSICPPFLTGATIDTQRTSQTYDCKDSPLCRILRFFWTASPPDTILQPNVFPGNCWAFKGRQGQVVIRLPARVYLTAITVQHITKEASPSGTIISAPKDIAVFVSLLGPAGGDVALGGGKGRNMLLPRAFSHVKLLVKSNWGNPWYTCIYRVKVHGKMENQKASTKDPDK